MTTIRTFVAIELSDQAVSQLTHLQSRLKENLPQNTVRWTVPKNIHLTLHFLGDLLLDNSDEVALMVRDVAATGSPFSLTLSNLGCFPNTRRPRIVWVGISGETEVLINLQRELGDRLHQRIGYRPEARPYSPHLTIGRVKKGIPQQRLRELGQFLEREIQRVGQVALLPVEGIHFIRSDLKPDGPCYTTLAHGKLGRPS